MNDPKRQSEYTENYNSFEKDMVAHFPIKLTNNFISSSWSSPKNVNEYGLYGGIHLLTKISSNENYKKLKTKLTRNAKHIGRSNDKCYMVVKTHGDLLDADFDKNSCKELFPVPQYAIYKSDDFDVNWSRQKGSDIVILDCKSGDYMNREKIQTKIKMPNEWKNGYSKGYTFNDKEQTLMYWLIIW